MECEWSIVGSLVGQNRRGGSVLRELTTLGIDEAEVMDMVVASVYNLVVTKESGIMMTMMKELEIKYETAPYGRGR